jgi:hypothetical protein
MDPKGAFRRAKEEGRKGEKEATAAAATTATSKQCGSRT